MLYQLTNFKNTASKQFLLILLSLLFSGLSFAQDELKITVTNNYQASGTSNSGVTINVYAVNGTVPIHTYTNTSVAQIVNTADWGGSTTDTYQIGYSNNITSFGTSSNTGYAARLLTIDQWGTATLSSLNFYYAINMDITATDAPTFDTDASLYRVFRRCLTMVDAGNNIQTWDTSNVVNMQEAFYNADAFNSTNLGNWDVGNVTNFQNMFGDTNVFNDVTINSWNIGENTGTSLINMSYMFNYSRVFNHPLNGWEANTGASMQYVANMLGMFQNAQAFNQNIGNWNVGRVTNFQDMFYRTTGNTPFNNGDAAGVIGTGMQSWTIGANLTTENISMYRMFREADSFNQDTSNWNLSNVTNFSEMFFNTNVFTGAGLNSWIIGGSNTNPINMRSMFYDANQFNNPLEGWESNPGSTMAYVTNMINMFFSTGSFNQPLNTWNVGRVTTFHQMFYQAAAFNNGDTAGEIGIGIQNWNIGANLTTETIDMHRMFRQASVFNQDLSNWDVTKVTDFSQMFYQATVFTGDGKVEADAGNEQLTSGLSNWKIGGTNTNPINMNWVFGIAPAFNEPLASWETNAGSTMAYVYTMANMFNQAWNFNQPLGDWDVGRVVSFAGTFANMNAFDDAAPSINTWNIGQYTAADAILMNSMFQNSNAFNSPLESWQTNADSSLEYVTNMGSMFMDADIFNQPLNAWDVSSVTNFGQMFYRSTGQTAYNNGDASGAIGTGLQSWNIGGNLTGNQAISMYRMFRNADQFNQNLNGWDVRRVNNFQETFWATDVFTGAGLRDWQISGNNTFPITMQNMFGAAVSFVEPLATWETDAGSTMAYVNNLHSTFNNTDAFNHPLGDWNVGRVTNFSYTFANNDGFTDSEPSIANWNIGQNTSTAGINMQGMFQANKAFNNSLEGWERAPGTNDPNDPGSTLAYVTTMRDMFRNGAIFNNTVNTWNVGRVGDFHAMFHLNPNFNQPVNNWNIGENRGNGINMQYTFGPAAAFNQPVNNWDVSKVQHFLNTFNGATAFDQSLAAWTPITGTDFRNMLSNSGLSVANYDATLTSWAQQDLVDNRVLGAVNLEFCAAEPFRASLVADQGWTIQGDILGCAPGSVSGSGDLLYWVSAGSVVADDGDPIDEWRDISGDGRVFTQTTPANQPTLLKNTTDMVNFNPLMKFDGADDYMGGFDFNAQDLSFPNTPRINLPIVARSASSELTITITPGGNPPPPPYDLTFTAARSALSNNYNGNRASVGSWRPATEPTPNANTTEYLELDLGEVVPLSTIRTRGEASNQESAAWVETYTVEISTDGTNFTQLDGTFTGNVDRTNVVLNEFSENTPAQYVRIYPQTWNGYPALQVGVGTKGYTATSTFLLALEDVRQNNTTQSLNHIDTNNRMDISVVDGSGNATVNNSFVGDTSIDLSATAPALSNKPFLINYTATGNGEAKLYRDGVEIASDATLPKYLLLGDTHLGGLPSGNYFNGKIAEANLLALEPSQEERERINTYFAIKYNIPLEHNFIYEDENTDIITVWDKTANAAYNNDVFGLAKDDNQGLNQSVSSTRNDDDKVLTVATVGDFTNLNSDPGRLSLTGTSAFVMMGNDDGAATFGPNNAPNKFHVLDRKWLAKVTGSPQNLFFEFNVGNTVFDVDTPPQTADYYFIKDDNSNGDLSDDTPILMINTSAELWSTPDAVVVEDGQIFTLAAAFTATPGGVAPDLALWLKADAGVSGATDVTAWDDQSVNNHIATATTGPELLHNAINFNPSLNFDDANSEHLNLDPFANAIISKNNAFYLVANNSESGGIDLLLYASNGTGSSYDGYAGNSILEFQMSYDNANQQRIFLQDNTGTSSSSQISNGLDTSVPKLNTGSWQAGAQLGFAIDGEGLITTTAPTSTYAVNHLRIGGHTGPSLRDRFMNGDISEVIVYNTDNTGAAISKKKIESYLALKYGITLDQTTATDYVSSGATPTLMWDSSVDTAYNSDIFGVGRDDASNLNQKVSKSVNDDSIFTISMDGDDFTKANKTVVNGHTNNLQFLSFASNGIEATDQVTELDAANYNLGISREWQVYKTANFDDAVNLKFEGFAGFDVIQSTDGDFSTDGDQTVLGTLDANGELTDVTGLISGSYISLAIYTQAPGGVTAELGLWLKANGNVYNAATTQAADGETVETWVDNSLNTNNGNETTNYPDFRNNAVDNINFNPVVDFNGTDDQMVLNPSYFASGSEARSYFAVGLPNTGAVENNHPVLDHGNGVEGRSNLTLSPTSVSSATGNSNHIGTHTIATPFIGSGSYPADSPLNAYTFKANGTALTATGANNTAVPNTINTNAYIGRLTNDPSFYYGGTIAEIIAYNDDMGANAADEQKIQSYLAIKYGITLDASISDYVSTAGTSIYNLASYNNDVFGIGNDMPQALNQEISKSVNTGAIVIISTDTDFTANNGLHTPLNDGQYLVIGNNGASGAVPSNQNTSDLDTNTYFNRVAREWKSSNTGSVGQVNLQFDGFDANWVLLTRTADGDFSATTGTTETQLSATGAVAVTLPATSYFTLAQKPIAIEFEAATANDAEATGGNLPNLLIDGELTVDATIDVVVNAAGTATANTDYTFGNATGDGATTLSATIPAGVYSAANPLPMATALVDDIALKVGYQSLTNPPNLSFERETFVPTETGNYLLTHSAKTINAGNGWVNVGTTLESGTGSDDILDGLNGDRINATNLKRTHTISLTAGTTYYLTAGAGGNSNLENVNIIITHPIGLSITDDAIVEANETISLSLSNPQNGLEVANVTGTDLIDTHVYTINNDDTATVTIAADADAVETTSARAFTVTMSEIASTDIDVSYTLTGTASNPDDYTDATAVAGTATIPAGSTTTTIAISVVDDTNAELTETVIATLTAATNNASVTGDTTSATMNITDDDLAALTISIGSPVDGTEGTSDISYEVSLDGGVTNETGATITGTLALTGTATNGTDYTDITTFSIADGASNATITVSVTDDSEVEVSETVIATISNPSVGSIATASATANILDDDAAALTISIGSPVDGTEGASDISYEITLDGGVTNQTGAAITGTLVLTGTATNGTDYTDVTTFSIADGATSATITVAITDDLEVEISETVIVTISNPSVGSIGTTSATANILDDDATALTISIGSPIDGTEGTSDISYEITLDGGVSNQTGSAITGTLALTGTATNGTDYTDLTTFSIADGASSATITVNITDDLEVEVSETVIATISNPSVGSIATTSATANILDDDLAALTISIGSPVDGTEGTSDISYEVTLDNGVTNQTGATITGTLALTGTATNGTDYTDITTFSIADGASSATIMVAISDDSEVEISETVIATISNSSLGSIATASATANILDDDAAALTISIGSPVDGTEGTSDINYEVSLDGGVTNNTGAAITGTLALTGSATNGADYTDVTIFSIADGATSATISVAITDDSAVEISETVIATISNPSVGSIATASATANILDDDAAALTISIGSPVDGTEGTSDISYEVSLDGGLTNQTGADITGTLTLSGTATNGSDYSDVTTFAIAEGMSAVSISVPVIDDSEIELIETVIATISTPNVGTINIASATANIIDNDMATITITADADADESILNRAFTLTMDKVALTDVEVAYVLSGSALNPDDYTDVSPIIGTITIPTGATTATIDLAIVDDNDVEQDETIIATMTAATNSAVVTASTTPATLNILDNDEILVSVIEDTDNDESVEAREFLVALDDVANVDVILEYTLSGTATISDDYTDVTGGSITIPAGMTVASIGLNIIDDELEEDDEEITVTITSQMTQLTFENTSATMTIIDNDECVLNCDTDGDGECDFNCDCDDDGIPDGDYCGEVGSISTVNPAQAFTPNGDGMNDFWVIEGIENYPNSVVKVYNRWGHEVFSAQGYQNNWGAIYKDNSRKLPPGSYYFIINLGDGAKPKDGWLFINY